MLRGKLRPCPFCGGEATVLPMSQVRDDGWIVKCAHDGAADPQLCAIAPRSTPLVTRAAAIKAWNTRK